MVVVFYSHFLNKILPQTENVPVNKKYILLCSKVIFQNILSGFPSSYHGFHGYPTSGDAPKVFNHELKHDLYSRGAGHASCRLRNESYKLSCSGSYVLFFILQQTQSWTKNTGKTEKLATMQTNKWRRTKWWRCIKRTIHQPVSETFGQLLSIYWQFTRLTMYNTIKSKPQKPSQQTRGSTTLHVPTRWRSPQNTNVGRFPLYTSQHTTIE